MFVKSNKKEKKKNGSIGSTGSDGSNGSNLYSNFKKKDNIYILAEMLKI